MRSLLLAAVALLLCALTSLYVVSQTTDVRLLGSQQESEEGHSQYVRHTSSLQTAAPGGAHTPSRSSSARPKGAAAHVPCDCSNSSGGASLNGPAAGPSRPLHVALAFFGLTRSLSHTIASIRENIFQPLDEAGHSYTVFLHTYDLRTLANNRTGEAREALNTTEWQLLEPEYHSITSQEAFLAEAALPMAACMSFEGANGTRSATATDYYADGFSSLRNLFCQLNSVAAVTRLWRAAGPRYDAVLYLRPDVLYNCPLPVELLPELRRDAVYVADFHHWHGYNDRFAMGAPEAVGHWGDRLQYAYATCMTKQLHAEMLVASLLEHYALEAELVPFYFFRVRANGLLEWRDHKPKWKSHEIPVCDEEQFAPFVEREQGLSDV